MVYIPFEKLYNTDFLLTEPIFKAQYWKQRGNIYSAIGRPKTSHTLLWFKNCTGRITDKQGNILEIKRNQMAFMSKGIEYTVEFFDTNESCEDTVVVHFQMTDTSGNDICPAEIPVICIKNVDIEFSGLIDLMAEEFKNNITCIPEMKAVIYKMLTAICQKQKQRSTKAQFTSIREGIKLMEQNSDMRISEIAKLCGVSECYFRRLFKEYSGESPMDFRQRHRIDKAKQLLLSDEGLSIGEISEELNFSDIYHFSKTFKKFTNVSPNKFIKQYEERK